MRRGRGGRLDCKGYSGMARWSGRNFGGAGDDTFERQVGQDRERVMYARHGEVRDRPRPRPAAQPPDPDNPADDSVAVREGRISPYAQNRDKAERAAPPPDSRFHRQPSQTEAFFEALRELRSSPEVQDYMRNLTRNAADAARRFAQNFEMPDMARNRRPTVEIFEDDEDDSPNPRATADRLRRRARRSRNAAPPAPVPPARKIDIDD